MHWELWDTGSANLVEDFATEDEALQAVREILAVNRPDYIDALALGAMYDEGESREAELPPVLSGAELKSRLAELAQAEVADSARTVHQRIRKWLSEEGWHVEDVTETSERFSIMLVATLHGGRSVNVLQGKDHRDYITIGNRVTFDEVFRSDFSVLPEKSQREIIWSVRNYLTWPIGGGGVGPRAGRRRGGACRGSARPSARSG